MLHALDLESPTKREGGTEENTEDLHEQLGKFSTVPSASRTVASQNFAMIGYGDEFTHEGEGGHYKLFEVGRDGNDGVQVTRALLAHMVQRRNVLFKKKMQVLKPLMDKLWKLYKIYYYACDEHFKSNPQILDNVIPPDESETDGGADKELLDSQHTDDSLSEKSSSSSEGSGYTVSSSASPLDSESSLTSDSTTDCSTTSEIATDSSEHPERNGNEEASSGDEEFDTDRYNDEDDDPDDMESSAGEEGSESFSWQSLNAYFSGSAKTREERRKKACLGAANNSLIGRFLQHLYEKCLNLKVFSFNGSR